MSDTSMSQLVKDTIYRASLSLDEQRWEDWLSLCHDEFYYAIKAFSPEINYDMIYLDGDRSEMVTLTEMLPKHNSDHSPLARHTVVYTVDINNDEKTASAVSSFAIYKTELDGRQSHVLAGESSIFVIGKYHDKFKIDSGKPLFTQRIVQLDTRRLDKGTHWPL